MRAQSDLCLSLCRSRDLPIVQRSFLPSPFSPLAPFYTCGPFICRNIHRIKVIVLARAVAWVHARFTLGARIKAWERSETAGEVPYLHNLLIFLSNEERASTMLLLAIINILCFVTIKNIVQFRGVHECVQIKKHNSLWRESDIVLQTIFWNIYHEVKLIFTRFRRIMSPMWHLRKRYVSIYPYDIKYFNKTAAESIPLISRNSKTY